MRSLSDVILENIAARVHYCYSIANSEFATIGIYEYKIIANIARCNFYISQSKLKIKIYIVRR